MEKDLLGKLPRAEAFDAGMPEVAQEWIDGCVDKARGHVDPKAPLQRGKRTLGGKELFNAAQVILLGT